MLPAQQKLSVSAPWAQHSDGPGLGCLLLSVPADLHSSLEASPRWLPDKVTYAVKLLMNETVHDVPIGLMHLGAGNTYCDGPNNCRKHYGSCCPTGVRTLFSHRMISVHEATAALQARWPCGLPPCFACSLCSRDGESQVK